MTQVLHTNTFSTRSTVSAGCGDTVPAPHDVGRLLLVLVPGAGGKVPRCGAGTKRSAVISREMTEEGGEVITPTHWSSWTDPAAAAIFSSLTAPGY